MSRTRCLTKRQQVALIVAEAIVVSGLIIAGLVVCAHIEAQWNSLMETVEISAWLPLSAMHWLAFCHAVELALCAVLTWRSLVVVFANRDRPTPAKAMLPLVVLSWLMVATSISKFVIIGDKPSLQAATVTALATKPLPVENFNRHICVAWCHGNAMVVSTPCGAPPARAALDFVAQHDDAEFGLWCESAIHAQSFQANTSFRGDSPFEVLDKFSNPPEFKGADNVLFGLIIAMWVVCMQTAACSTAIMVERFLQNGNPRSSHASTDSDSTQKAMLAKTLVETSA